MIFISLTPLSPRRLLLFFATAICLIAVSCFAQPTFFAVKSTPYDKQMIRIRPILQISGSRKDAELSLRLVNHWIEDLRAIPYAFSQEWKTPAEVESGLAADCKGKAVALYEKMRRSGATNIRLVIGRRTATSRSTHAWLEWSACESTYVLDPTINWMAFKSDEIGKENYRPLYAFAGNHKFCATTGALLAKN